MNFYFTTFFSTEDTPAKSVQKFISLYPNIEEVRFISTYQETVKDVVDAVVQSLESIASDFQEDQELFIMFQMNPMYNDLLSFLPEDTFVDEKQVEEFHLNELEFTHDEIFRVWLHSSDSVEYDYETNEQFPPTPDLAIGYMQIFSSAPDNASVH